MSRPVVLTLCDYFLPGYRAGGPITTLVNMVSWLSDELEFRVVTRDRDLGTGQPYPGIRHGEWHDVGRAHVQYVPPGRAGWQQVRTLLQSRNYDVLYLNSFFSPVFTTQPLLLRRLGKLPDRPVVIAPRGELLDGALSLSFRKRWKKIGFLRLTDQLALYRGVTWQASAAAEADAIERFFGPGKRVIVAPDLLARDYVTGADPLWPSKTAGRLKLLFLSRIDMMKNLRGALELLRDVNGEVEFNIVGPISDQAYWGECERLIAALPSNVSAHYRGLVAPAQVRSLMAENDLLILLTLGENFGHVIPEALSAGCPVLISDRTPWPGLQKSSAGWDLPLEHPRDIRRVLQQCIHMDDAAHRQLRRGAREFAAHYVSEGDSLARNCELFRSALAGAPQLRAAG